MQNLYNEIDKQNLKKFLAQYNNDAEDINASLFSVTKEELHNDNEQWIEKISGVTWNEDKYKQISHIDWDPFSTQWPDTRFRLEGDLDMQGATQLTSLSVDCHSLTVINVSGCLRLEMMEFFDSGVESLNINECTNLTWLNCELNCLTTLDLKHCPNLVMLYCGVNWFTTLDLSNNTKLTTLWCENRQLTSLTVGWSTLPTLDLRLPEYLDNITLNVPKNTRKLYQNDEIWNKFGNIVEI